MKCPNCNETDHEPTAKFCHVCGVKLSSTKPLPSKRDKRRLNGLIIRVIVYIILVTIFTFFSIWLIFTAWDISLLGRLFFLVMILLGLYGGITGPIKYYKNRDKDELLGQTVLFIWDSCLILACIFSISSMTLYLKLRLVVCVLLMFGFAIVLRRGFIRSNADGISLASFLFFVASVIGAIYMCLSLLSVNE